MLPKQYSRGKRTYGDTWVWNFGDSGRPQSFGDTFLQYGIMVTDYIMLVWNCGDTFFEVQKYGDTFSRGLELW